MDLFGEEGPGHRGDHGAEEAEAAGEHVGGAAVGQGDHQEGGGGEQGGQQANKLVRHTQAKAGGQGGQGGGKVELGKGLPEEGEEEEGGGGGEEGGDGGDPGVDSLVPVKHQPASGDGVVYNDGCGVQLWLWCTMIVVPGVKVSKVATVGGNIKHHGA